MIKQANLSLVYVLFFVVSAHTQEMGQLVSMEYQDKPLKFVLNDITSTYGVNFTYSSSVVPVYRKVSFAVEEAPLGNALDQLFEENSLTHAEIGDQIVIKAKKQKRKAPPARITKLTKIETSLPSKVKQQTPLYSDPRQEELLARYYRQKYKNIAPIQGKELTSLPGGGERVIEWDSERINSMTEDIMTDEPFTRLAQVSILPYVGTNKLKSDEMTNNLSLNVFWGTNGGVDGVEVGGFVNSIRNDVKGVQVAGLGNSVGNDVTGTQVSGLFNTARGELEGAQVSGLFNYAGEAKAVQVSSLFNMSPKAFSGVQVSSLFNVSGEGDGVQVSGLINTNRGRARTQVAGLFNTAGDISGAQVSAIMNIAKDVKGFQFALINIADTITGAPIGLLNIIKNGYNRVELASSEALFTSFSLKLGAKAFYNIFHVGLRWDRTAFEDGLGQQQEEVLTSWGLGYGIGTAVTIGPRTLMNIEALATHINETEAWTTNLNLLTQLKILFDLRVGRRTSFFAGPSGNLMVSNLYDADTNTYGSNIMPYTLYETTQGETNTKVWVGFNAGVRF